jgi:hypothetical protein
MADLHVLDSMSYDLIVPPVSNTVVADVWPVWREAFRVLRSGGILLAGFMNRAAYLVDYELAERTGILQVKYRIPYALPMTKIPPVLNLNSRNRGLSFSVLLIIC